MLKKKNIVFLLLIFVLSIGYLISAFSLGSPITDGNLTPSFFPMILGFSAILFSFILIWREASAISKEEDSHEKVGRSHIWVMISIFLYIIVFYFLGYFISSLLFVFSIIIIFSSWEKAVQKAAMSAAIVAIGYLMFEQLFGVRLPALWE